MNTKRFGSYVKSLRGPATRKEFGKGEINDQYLYQIETGARSPSLDFLLRLAHLLNIRPGLLLDQLDDKWEDERGEVMYIPPELIEEDKEVLLLLAEALAVRRKTLTSKEPLQPVE
jgi:transcriptional regulator with XRE-family HTH domain